MHGVYAEIIVERTLSVTNEWKNIQGIQQWRYNRE